MTTNYIRNVDHDKKINYEKFIGELSILDIIESRKAIVYSDDYQDSHHILLDIREAVITDFIQNISIFFDFVDEFSKIRNINRKCAVLTIKPVDVVDSELVKMNLSRVKPELKIEIFSTESAALNWLNNT